MSGWVLIKADKEYFRLGFERFRRIFSLQNIPELKTRLYEISPDKRIVLWNWSGTDEYPDTEVVSPNRGEALLLDGRLHDDAILGVDRGDSGKSFSWPKFQNLIEANQMGQLDGSFSLVGIEPDSGKIWAVTDRIASRPVWYTREGKAGIWGNFPAAVAAFRKENIVDQAGLWSLLATSRPVVNRSIFKDVFSIPSGSVARFEGTRSPRISSWFELQYKPDYSKSAKEWGRIIAVALRQSAMRITRASESNYLFLSGGMDSRVAAASFGRNLTNVTLTTEPNMNSRIAEAVSRRLGQKHRTMIRDPYCYLKTFEAAAMISGGNYNITHAHFIWPVMEIQKEDPNAAFLLGDMLENFSKHYFKPAWQDPDALTPENLPTLFYKLYSYSVKDIDNLKSLFLPGIADQMENEWAETLTGEAERIRKVSGNDADYLDSLFRWSNTQYCPTNLMHECIKPFAPLANVMYDNELLDLVTRVPAEMKKKGTLHREILKNLNPKMLMIPNSNFWLPPVFPRWVENGTRKVRPVLGKVRRKIMTKKTGGPVIKTEGSWHMLHEWYRKDPEYNYFVEKTLTSGFFTGSGMFDKLSIENSMREFMVGDLLKLPLVNHLLSFTLLGEVMGFSKID